MLKSRYMADKARHASKQVVVSVVIVMIGVFFALLSSYTKYIYAQDYSFIIEASCDPAETSCYVRDCDDYCPPNELEVYSSYLISANDYADCTDNSCSNICENTTTAELCVPIECNSDNNDCTS